MSATQTGRSMKDEPPHESHAGRSEAPVIPPQDPPRVDPAARQAFAAAALTGLMAATAVRGLSAESRDAQIASAAEQAWHLADAMFVAEAKIKWEQAKAKAEAAHAAEPPDAPKLGPDAEGRRPHELGYRVPEEKEKGKGEPVSVGAARGH